MSVSENMESLRNRLGLSARLSSDSERSGRSRLEQMIQEPSKSSQAEIDAVDVEQRVAVLRDKLKLKELLATPSPPTSPSHECVARLSQSSAAGLQQQPEPMISSDAELELRELADTPTEEVELVMSPAQRIHQHKARRSPTKRSPDTRIVSPLAAAVARKQRAQKKAEEAQRNPEPSEHLAGPSDRPEAAGYSLDCRMLCSRAMTPPPRGFGASNLAQSTAARTEPRPAPEPAGAADGAVVGAEGAVELGGLMGEVQRDCAAKINKMVMTMRELEYEAEMKQQQLRRELIEQLHQKRDQYASQSSEMLAWCEAEVRAAQQSSEEAVAAAHAASTKQQEQHTRELEELKRLHQASLAQQRAEHAQELAALREEHRRELGAQSQQHEEAGAAAALELAEQGERLRYVEDECRGLNEVHREELEKLEAQAELRLADALLVSQGAIDKMECAEAAESAALNKVDELEKQLDQFHEAGAQAAQELRFRSSIASRLSAKLSQLQQQHQALLLQFEQSLEQVVGSERPVSPERLKIAPAEAVSPSVSVSSLCSPVDNVRSPSVA